eukprot:7377409-Prymnesium_polylepis.2
MCPSASKSRQANGLAQGVRCQPVAAVPHSSARCVLGCPYPPSRLVSLVLVTVRVAAFDVAWQGYGSAQPTVVLSGHISTPEDGPVASRTGQIQCPPGGWCSAGIAIACDVGFYTDPQIAPTQRTSPAACIACPRHSTSSSGSTSIDDCGCVEGRVQVPGGSKSSCGCPFGLHESESGMCDVCPRFTSSSAGAVTCDICAEGRFRLDARTSVSTENCNQCPTGAICSFNTTVATMELLEGFWRISMETSEVSACEWKDDYTPCRGGVDAGDHGVGYCAPGHRGPWCQLCNATSLSFILQEPRHYYFSPEDARCHNCTTAFVRAYAVLLAVLLFVLGVIITIVIIDRRIGWSSSLRKVIRSTRKLWRRAGMRFKIKAIVGLYQCVGTVSSVYDVKTPAGLEQYITDWVSILEVANFGLDFAMPSSCFGSYRRQLWIMAGWPILLVLVAVAGSVGWELRRGEGRTKDSTRSSLAAA